MKVSIVTVSYNSAHTIAKTIESVMSQDYDDIEYIVIDGLSDDATLDIINDYSPYIDKVCSEKDAGIYDAMNKGIELASGEIIGFLNSDDTFHSAHTIIEIVSAFQEYDSDCTYGNLNYVNNFGKITRKWRSKPFKKGLFEKSWTPAHPTFYCKRILYQKFGAYRTDYKIAADVELMYRFLEINKIKPHFISSVLVDMLEGGVSNNSLKSSYIITREMVNAFEQSGQKLPIGKYLFYKMLKLTEWIK